jgi:hypothetical protein
MQRRAQHLDRGGLAGNRAFAFGDQTELGILQPNVGGERDARTRCRDGLIPQSPFAAIGRSAQQ